MEVISNILFTILLYIQKNSIDFISIVASILVAIETNKWIERKQEKKGRKRLLNDLMREIEMIKLDLERDVNIQNEDEKLEKLTLRVMPYNAPFWSSIQNTNKIDLLTQYRGYKKIMEFYAVLTELNIWESILSCYILFSTHSIPNSNQEDVYKSILVEQVIHQRTRTLFLAEKIQQELKEV